MKIALDVDGVCLNWFKRVCEVYNKPYVAEVWDLPWIKEEWSSISKHPECWIGLEAIDYPNFDFDIYLTSMPDIWLYVRQANLYSLDFPIKPVIISHDKVNYCLDNGIDLLIDDRPQTILEAQKAELACVQIYPEYARYPIVGDWFVDKISELPSVINKIKEDGRK